LFAFRSTPTGEFTVGPAPRFAAVVLCSLLLARTGNTQEGTAPPSPAQLAAMERVRPLVDAIWLDVRTPSKSDEERPLYFWEVTDKLIAIGPDVVPFVVAEIDLMDPSTFHFCAYTLGQLGGKDAEAALRRAIRAANAQGGRFGVACKRYALFGLALLGATDVIDLMQTGESMLGAVMVPELPLATHLALVVGPALAPSVEKQLEANKAVPAAIPNLDETLLATGRVGDASFIPMLEPLLANATPEVRALAADATSRLGEPKLCEKLVAPLSSVDANERRLVAKSFERWKPEPCYKAMVGRLEVEDDIAVRGALYNAIVAMAGESSLDVLRAYVRSTNQFDQALVILAIGQVGSKKGLNLLRGLLSDEDLMTVVRALESISAIGGDGATDTLLATTSDGRPFVAAAARDILVKMGVKKVAPRVASALLEVVRKPVTDLRYRTPIAEWGDGLVKLGYTEPIDELRAAVEVQGDPEIKESLSSCVRRLQRLAANGDDVAAWDKAAVSPFGDVRRLAFRRLAEIGSPAAVRAIATRLAKSDVPPEERAAALIAVGEARTEGAVDIVERHLSDPAYDVWQLQRARSAAAFAARRLGGDRMIRALRQSAVRRDGRDWATLVYLAVIEKGAALPILKDLRVRRLRYPESPFGHQEWQVDAIISDLAAGRDLKRFDVPPDALSEL
jgi:HEAT repeat protein